MIESQAQQVPESKHFKLPSNPKKSPCFPIPDYMDAPQVYCMYGHQIRIWRTCLVPLTEADFRHTAGIIDYTDLKTGLTLGLQWAYSTHQKPEWKPIKYQLYSWFPGPQPCKDLDDVYRSTTKEIKWVVSTIRREYEERTRPRAMLPEAQGVFPQ